MFTLNTNAPKSHTHRQHRSGALQRLQRQLHIGAFDVRKLRHTARTEEALEADYALCDHRHQIAGIAGHNAAPEGDVDVHFLGGDAAFLGQIGDGRCGRNGVSL